MVLPPGALFSLEMSRFEIGMRMLCADAGVPWTKVRAARVGAEDWGRLVGAAEALHDAPLYIVDSGSVTMLDVRAKARRLRSGSDGLGLVVVDYLQLMSGSIRRDTRQLEVAELSRSLKLLAKELDIPVIAVSQLNRDPERRPDKRPQLADLRDSGSLEQDADVVLFLHRSEQEATRGPYRAAHSRQAPERADGRVQPKLRAGVLPVQELRGRAVTDRISIVAVG